MNSIDPSTTHFFLYAANPESPLPTDWHLILRPDEQIEIAEPSWIKNREVTVSIKDEMAYTIVAAAVGPVTEKKLYRLVRFGSDITFYFNNFLAFLEVKQSSDPDKSLALAIQFFNKLLRKAYGKSSPSTPLILFVE